MIGGAAADVGYLREICLAAAEGGWLPENLRQTFKALLNGLNLTRGDALLRLLNEARHGLLTHLGMEPAEWDFAYAHSPALAALRSEVIPHCGEIPRCGDIPRKTFPLRMYLDDIRSPFNVGSIFRTAEAFGAEKILLSPLCPSPEHPRCVRTAMGAVSMLPWERVEGEVLKLEKNLFALEQGGTPITEFQFPAEGLVILGAEELGVSPEALALADEGLGRVSIPLYGAKASLNVSVAFGILMNVWTARVVFSSP